MSVRYHVNLHPFDPGYKEYVGTCPTCKGDTQNFTEESDGESIWCSAWPCDDCKTVQCWCCGEPAKTADLMGGMCAGCALVLEDSAVSDFSYYGRNGQFEFGPQRLLKEQNQWSL